MRKTQHLAHYLEIDSTRYQQGGCRVAQVVESDARQPRSFQQGIEPVLDEVGASI